MNYTKQTIEKTQRVLDLLVENPELTNEKLRDITGWSLPTIKHTVSRLYKHGCLASEKDRSSHQYRRILRVIKTDFREVLEHE